VRRAATLELPYSWLSTRERPGYPTATLYVPAYPGAVRLPCSVRCRVGRVTCVSFCAQAHVFCGADESRVGTGWAGLCGKEGVPWSLVVHCVFF
jgi:hypothetical protein